MKVNALLLSALAGAVGLALSGCVVTGSVHEREYYGGPRVVEAPPPGYVIVREPPPRLVVEAPPPRAPRPDMVWVPGYYVQERGGWVLVPGHYDSPPRRGAVWVPPRHESSGVEVRYYSGFWR